MPSTNLKLQPCQLLLNLLGSSFNFMSLLFPVRFIYRIKISVHIFSLLLTLSMLNHYSLSWLLCFRNSHFSLCWREIIYIFYIFTCLSSTFNVALDMMFDLMLSVTVFICWTITCQSIWRVFKYCGYIKAIFRHARMGFIGLLSQHREGFTYGTWKACPNIHSDSYNFSWHAGSCVFINR